MRVVHAYKKLDLAWKDYKPLNICLWILSVLQWKRFGHTPVLYTDKETLKDLRYYGVDKLYKEINTTVLTNKQITKEIDFSVCWSMAKILAYHHELTVLNNNVIISDTDLIPLKHFKPSSSYVWSEENYSNTYIPKQELDLCWKKDLPKWITTKRLGYNAGLVFIKNANYAKEYCETVIEYSKRENIRKTDFGFLMVNLEQRFLYEYLKYKNIKPKTLTNQGQRFTKEAIHLFASHRNLSLNLTISFLWWIKSLNKKVYQNLISLPEFKTEKERIESEQSFACSHFLTEYLPETLTFN